MVRDFWLSLLRQGVGIWLLAGAVTCWAAPVQASEHTSSPSGLRPFHELDESEQKEFRKRFEPLVVIVALSFFFAIVVYLLGRSSRYFKRHARIGEKNKPTELPDAWSNYRLEDDPLERRERPD